MNAAGPAMRRLRIHAAARSPGPESMHATASAAIPRTASTALKDSIAWAGDLPALPEAVLDLLALLGAEDVDIDELCARLSVDMALTAKVLRLANSSFYGARGEVTSVDAAIGRVGLRMVRGIVTAAGVSGTIKPPVCAGFDFAAFWRHGVATAAAAQMLAFATGADSSTAFTTGLLYRIGQLVLASQVPVEFAETIAHRAANGGDALLIERAVLGVDHAMVGARIAAHWRLPATIVAAMSQQDLPLARGNRPTLGQVAGAADRLIEAFEAGETPVAAAAGSAAEAWAAAGAPGAFWERSALDASRQAEAISSALAG